MTSQRPSAPQRKETPESVTPLRAPDDAPSPVPEETEYVSGMEDVGADLFQGSPRRDTCT